MTVGGTGDVLSGLLQDCLSRNKNMIRICKCWGNLCKWSGRKIIQKEFGNHILASDLISVLPKVY